MTANDGSAAMLAWLAAIGAAPADELARAAGLSTRAGQRRLQSLQSAGLVRWARLLHGEPALYVATRRGLRAAGRGELDPTTLSASGFAHALAVARVAGALRDRGRDVGGERELRALERARGRPIASAAVGLARDGGTGWHRPDLVCWDPTAPLAIEVELTVKAPERLRAIVRGWARSRLVGGVVYYASPAAARAVAVAIAREDAGERVALTPIGALVAVSADR